MKCPICGAAQLVRDTRDVPYTYKGEATAVLAAVGDYCPACGEGIFDMEQANRINALMSDFNRQVNAAIVDPTLAKKIEAGL